MEWRDFADRLSCGVRCGGWTRSAQAGSASGLANRFRDHGGVTCRLYRRRGGRGSVCASRRGFDSKQCAHREPPGATRSALCVAWGLAAVRYALVFADRRARIRSAHGGDFLSAVSGGDSGSELVHTRNRGGPSRVDGGGVFFLLGIAASRRFQPDGDRTRPHAAPGGGLACQLCPLRGICGIFDNSAHRVGGGFRASGPMVAGSTVRVPRGIRSTLGRTGGGSPVRPRVAEPARRIVGRVSHAPGFAGLLGLAPLVGTFVGRGSVPAVPGNGSGSAVGGCVGIGANARSTARCTAGDQARSDRPGCGAQPARRSPSRRQTLRPSGDSADVAVCGAASGRCCSLSAPGLPRFPRSGELRAAPLELEAIQFLCRGLRIPEFGLDVGVSELVPGAVARAHNETRQA